MAALNLPAARLVVAAGTTTMTRLATPGAAELVLLDTLRRATGGTR